MLEFRGAGFAYPGSEWIFRDINLTVAPGSITAVLGPNGRGKTTLVRCAAGLLKPQEGSVLHNGPIGFVPQAHGTAFAYNALDMVLMGRARHIHVFGVPSGDDRVASLDAMKRIGIGHLRERQFPTLSGGEQQLVLIARAIASECPTLVLDEPSTGLDLRNQTRILNLLLKLVADGMSVLLTTHDPDHALYLADSVVLMLDGEVRTGAAVDLLTDDALSDLYDADVHTVHYDQGGVRRRAIVTAYDDSAYT